MAEVPQSNLSINNYSNLKISRLSRCCVFLSHKALVIFQFRHTDVLFAQASRPPIA
ncbi:hypothetical protein J2X75_001526 [Paenibacillus sp. 2003]|nr:hypothetical protein [Paenibacillus sp. 2003]